MSTRTEPIPTHWKDTNLKKRFNRAWIPLLPAIVLFSIQFILPLAIVAVTGFQRSLSPGNIEPSFTLENFQKILTEPYYLGMFWRSVTMAAGTAVVAAFLGFPLAWGLARGSRWLRTTLLILIMVPLMTSSVVRSFGWMVLFQDGGFYSWLFAPLANESTGLMYTQAGLIISMSHVMLPLMVLTLYGVIDKLDPTLEGASMSLGAGRIRTFFRITLPLTMGGVVSGMVLVFATSISAFVTPKLIGGTQLRVIATEIYEQAIILLNWPLAAAMAILLMAVTLGATYLYSAISNRIWKVE